MQGPCPSNRSAPCFAPTGMEKSDEKMQLGSRWQNTDQLRSSVLAAAASLMFLTVTTSSTAQGGGGSFKNRKPIGEVGGCESGMAERSH